MVILRKIIDVQLRLNIDFIFLLSLMVIDETDNTEYFLYKFNISKKINIIKYNFLLKNCDKNVKMIKKRIKNGFLWQFMA